MRQLIASIIVRDLFDDDQDYMPDALECADSILKAKEFETIRKALAKTDDVIDATYGHDEHGERDVDSTNPEHSAADVVQLVMELEHVVGAAMQAIGDEPTSDATQS